MLGLSPARKGRRGLTVGEAAESRISDLAKGQGPVRLCSQVCLMPASLPDPHCPAEEVGGGQHDLGTRVVTGWDPRQRHFWLTHSFSTKTCMCPSPLTQRGLEGLSRPKLCLVPTPPTRTPPSFPRSW